ncbi:MAG: hypothetical protein ACFFD6_11390, partial [Candidatus Thorarchaeota archaeon]
MSTGPLPVVPHGHLDARILAVKVFVEVVPFKKISEEGRKFLNPRRISIAGVSYMLQEQMVSINIPSLLILGFLVGIVLLIIGY